MSSSLTILLLLPFVFHQFVGVQGSDPEAMQDFCVADLLSNVRVNGYPCKDPSTVTSSDFYYHGLAQRGDTNNRLGALVTPAFVSEFPGLNTLGIVVFGVAAVCAFLAISFSVYIDQILGISAVQISKGISIVRVDFAPWGLNTLHSHPRASEVLIVTEGTLLAGFVTGEPNQTFFSEILEKGDVFLFPRGMIHFQQNVKNKNATAIAVLNSQNPGRIDVADASFGSNPLIPDYVLARAFQIDKRLVDELQAKFSQPSPTQPKSNPLKPSQIQPNPKFNPTLTQTQSNLSLVQPTPIISPLSPLTPTTLPVPSKPTRTANDLGSKEQVEGLAQERSSKRSSSRKSSQIRKPPTNLKNMIGPSGKELGPSESVELTSRIKKYFIKEADLMENDKASLFIKWINSAPDGEILAFASSGTNVMNWNPSYGKV